ncbi:OsmC family protein [Actinomyces wuliandei]|uniref:OsmC family protein n=1 Tax=Actinomyces wuliandei TaxID=2057743 RepID=UPI000FD8DC39|nr:OsmC family protein [Actinomyces wuliandei]
MSEHSATTPSPPSAVWAERVGTRQYIGRNANGAEVRVGMGSGEFSPGELLKIALATCNTLSADHRLAKALGDDFAATVGCSSVKNEEEERYESLQVEIVTDLSALDPEKRQLLAHRVEGAIERSCTVGHTIERGATVSLDIVDPDED